MRAAKIGILPTTLSGWKHLLQHAVALDHDEVKTHRPEHFSLRSLETNMAFHFSMPSPKQGSHATTPKESAVLVLLTPTAPVATNDTCLDLACILTMRASGLRSHAKQMSFPGGRLDAGESAVDAAVRETWEEVGITADQYDVLGALSRIWSQPSKSWVTPILAVAKQDMLFPRIHSLEEVESLHYVHLEALLLQSKHTHHRMNKHRSSTAPWSVSMPCFFASDDVDKVIVEQPLPPNGRVASRKEDWGLTPTTEEYCKGTMVWGLTAYVLSELLVRLTLAVNNKQEGVLTLRSSKFVIRDAEEGTSHKSNI